MYSNNEDRAVCVSNRMSNTYNKNKWSCILGMEYGYNIVSIKNLSYKYKYNNIDWIVYLGAY
jgi:hypothetical protein